MPTQPEGLRAETIYLIDREWHTEIGLAVRDGHDRPCAGHPRLSCDNKVVDARDKRRHDKPRGDYGDAETALKAITRHFPGVRYLAIGFGDRAYLESRHRGFLVMVRALFPGRGLLLVTALRATPTQAFGAANVVALRVSHDGFENIVRFVAESFIKSAEGEPVMVGAGPYPGSLFFASSATYDLAYTCNTWTAEALSDAGLRLTPDGVIFAGQIMHGGRRIAAEQALAVGK